MAHTHTTALPDYERPPVVETVMGVQFAALPGFSVAHMGAFWESLGRDEWPVAMQERPIPASYERFSDGAEFGRRLNLELTDAPACRVQMVHSDKSRMVQVQNGRLHVNWIGLSGGDYPRYAAVRDEFEDKLDRFEAFIEQDELGVLDIDQWEVTYVNHIRQGDLWTSPADWDFFTPLRGVPSIDGVIEGESFQGEWHFVIPGQKGRLHVQWSHTRSATDGTPLVRLVLTARGAVNDEPPLVGIDLGRETIVRAFRELMSDDANRFWGLKDAGHLTTE